MKNAPNTQWKAPRFSRRIWGLSAILLAIACIPLSGCESTDAHQREALKFFGITYFNYQQIWKKPPANWDELLKLAPTTELPDDRKLLEQVRQSGYTILWEIDCMTSDAAEVVLAYPPDALDRGGDVLFAEGSVRKMSADELKQRL